MNAPEIICPRCKKPVLKVTILYNRHGAYTRCAECGREIRLIRQPQPVQPRQRPHMSKKERRQQRAKTEGGVQ